MPVDFTKRNINAKRSKNTRVAPDSKERIRYKQRVVDQQGKSGVVPLYGGETVAHYDSRPINAVDFNFSTLATWTVTGGAGDTLTVNYSIPNGYNAVLRGYRYLMVPTLALNYDELLVDVWIDGTPRTQGSFGQMHGQAMENYEPTFLLAGEGAVIALNFRASAALGPAASVRKTQVWLMGNLLLDTGRPLNQEVSNKKLSRPILKKV